MDQSTPPPPPPPPPVLRHPNGFTETQRAFYKFMNIVHGVLAVVFILGCLYFILDDLSTDGEMLDGLGVVIGSIALGLPLITLILLGVSYKIKNTKARLILSTLGFLGMLSPFMLLVPFMFN